jgi:hypothetical protein
MNSKQQFAAFEFMCHGRATLARKEMEYWLVEAEEWKVLREAPDPLTDGKPAPASGFTESSYQ